MTYVDDLYLVNDTLTDLARTHGHVHLDESDTDMLLNYLTHEVAERLGIKPYPPVVTYSVMDEAAR